MSTAKIIGQRLFYGVTRLAALVVALAPIAFIAFIVMMAGGAGHHTAPGHDYTIWATPILMTTIPMAVILGIWFMAKRATVQEVSFGSQGKFLLHAAGFFALGMTPLWLAKITQSLHLGALTDILQGLCVISTLIVMGAGLRGQSWSRKILCLLLFLSGLAVVVISSFPTC
jgi:hypothetical protein